MTFGGAAEGIEIGGFREWLPIPLEGRKKDFVKEMVAHFADDPASPRTIRSMAAALADLGSQLVEASNDDSLMISAWSLLPPGGDRLELRGMVTMVCQRVAENITPDQLIEQMCGEIELYQPPEVEVLDTKSGPAHLVRLRQYQEQDGSLDLSEIVLCFWLSPELPGVAVLMTSMPMPDLVAAADLADAFRPLAESVSGL